MMNRFTERAQEALQRAQQIMFAKQHTQLDVEHVFLALLQQRNSLPAQIITRLEGDVQNMTRRIEAALNNMPSYGAGRGNATTGYITLRAQRVLQGAAEEADRLNDEFISTEHLLLAIANERGGKTAAVLQEAGIDYERVVEAVREIRSGDQGAQTREEVEGEWPSRSKTIVNPPGLARARGFSHGILASGRMLFLAGQTAVDAEGNIVAPGDIVGQYTQV